MAKGIGTGLLGLEKTSRLRGLRLKERLKGGVLWRCGRLLKRLKACLLWLYEAVRLRLTKCILGECTRYHHRLPHSKWIVPCLHWLNRLRLLKSLLILELRLRLAAKIVNSEVIDI